MTYCKGVITAKQAVETCRCGCLVAAGKVPAPLQVKVKLSASVDSMLVNVAEIEPGFVGQGEASTVCDVGEILQQGAASNNMVVASCSGHSSTPFGAPPGYPS